MDKEKFKTIVENAMDTASNDVEKHSQIDDRKVAIENLKRVSDIWIDYQKMEDAHEENLIRLENDKIKYLNDNDYRRQQLEIEDKNNTKESIIKIGKFVIKTMIIVGGVVSAHRFETGGSFTSTLGRSIFPSMARSLVDDFNKA